jgi:hypothetical protein
VQGLRKPAHHQEWDAMGTGCGECCGRPLTLATLALAILQSINARRGIEKVFGWIKQWGGLCQFKVRGTGKVSAVFGLHVIAYNLNRLGNLLKPAMAAA